ncbi:MAG: NDP-sugar synthase [Deltaproteobacteria bacterium]|nr:NDP-sugar synthase [Deltaproteobacteria bacterium]
MKAMLLAAGFGTRLRPLTYRIPKPLIPVNGIPLIFYNLALLKKHGIRDVVINLHYLGQKIKNLLGTGKKFGFHFTYSTEKKILGTGGGIKKAEKFLKNGPFLVLNGDIITDLPLEHLMKLHRRQKPYATLVVIKSRLARHYGILYTNREREIVSILQQPKNGKKYDETFFTGVHLLDRRFFKNQKRGVKACIIRDNYIPRLQKGEQLAAFFQKGYWNDLGTKERWQKTNRLFKQSKIRLSYNNHLEEFRKILSRKKKRSH